MTGGGAVKATALCIAAALLAARTAGAAVTPHATLTASSADAILTEEIDLTLTLVLPALPAPFENQPPFLNRRAPHVTADFLERGGVSGAFVPTDPKTLFADADRCRDRDAPAFTLNDYVSGDLFSSMADPFGMFDDDFFGRALGPRKTLFPFRAEKIDTPDGPAWRFSVTTTRYRAAAPGTATFGPVRLRVPLITAVRTGRDRFGRPAHVPEFRDLTLRTDAVTATVAAPPAAGRPASYCGAIASNLAVRATLDTNICTAGDPLTLTLDVAGATDLAAVHPPALDARAAEPSFRIDPASVKTDTLSDRRRFTWRVRALKAGTGEFPSLPVAWFDLASRTYKTSRTEPLPVQVKAGAQATLGALDATGDEAEVFPFPDGITTDPRGAAAEPFLPHLRTTLALFLLPPLLFLAVRLAPPVRRRVAARNAAARRASAYARCRRALTARDPARRRRAIADFFATRYGVNGAAVTAGDAARLMQDDFTPEEIAAVTAALDAAAKSEFSARGAGAALLAAVAFCVVCGAARADTPSHAAFAWSRANALAARATDEDGFRAAADAYEACAAAGAANPVLFANLGACRLMAGDARAAQAAFARAERRGGETPSLRRGLLAARARLMNDPRADLPPVRHVLRPHYVFSADARLTAAAAAWAVLWLAALLPPGVLRRVIQAAAAVVCAAAALSAGVSLGEEFAAVGVLCARPGRRRAAGRGRAGQWALLLAAAAGVVLGAGAQTFSLMRKPTDRPAVTGRVLAKIRPSHVWVGEPCELLLSVETAADVTIEDLRVGGLPDEGAVYGEGFENLPDEPSGVRQVMKQMRLPVTFTAPGTQEVALVVQGMAVTRRSAGAAHFTSSVGFNARTEKPFTVSVRALPEERRPANFQGAVGTKFVLKQDLAPDKVRPGDLVTATYTLTYDGWCPSNVWPTIERLSGDFKTYEPKETARGDGTVVWTQMIVPQTSAATNSALASVPYFNTRAGRYEIARAMPKPLTFLSDAAAPTENTAVVVTAPEADADAARAEASGVPLVLRFAPSDASPPVATLPPGTPARETERAPNGWRRLETPRAAGWTKGGAR